MTEATITTNPPDPANGSSQQPSGDATADELRARLHKVQSEAAGLREKDTERKRKETDKAKKAADKAAVDKGEASKVIEELQAKVAKQQELVDAFNKGADERLTASIGLLSEDVQKEIEFVRDGMSREKLEEYIKMKTPSSKPMDDGTKGVPSPGATTGAKRRDEDPLDAGTKELLDTLMADETVYEIGRQIGHFPISKTGDEKFRFMGTGDDDEDTRRWIRFVTATADDPFRAAKQARLERVKALREAV